MAEEGGSSFAEVLKALLEDRQLREKELAEERTQGERKNSSAGRRSCLRNVRGERRSSGKNAVGGMRRR